MTTKARIDALKARLGPEGMRILSIFGVPPGAVRAITSAQEALRRRRDAEEQRDRYLSRAFSRIAREIEKMKG